MYWIVGKTGQLAQALAFECKRRNIPYLASSKDSVDITLSSDVKNFFASYPISHIINASGYTDVEKAEDETEKAFSINSEALVNLAETKAKIIHFSTDYVFDGNAKTPYKESDRKNPLNVYGMSKSLGEEKLIKLSPNALVIRVSALFGEFGNNFVRTMFSLMQKKSVLQIVDDQFVKPTYSGDVAEATLKMLDMSGVFHFANSESLSWYQFAREIFERLKAFQSNLCCKEILPISSDEYPQKAKRPQFSALCTEKIEKVLSFNIPSYKIGLDKTLLTWAGERQCENLEELVYL